MNILQTYWMCALQYWLKMACSFMKEVIFMMENHSNYRSTFSNFYNPLTINHIIKVKRILSYIDFHEIKKERLYSSISWLTVQKKISWITRRHYYDYDYTCNTRIQSHICKIQRWKKWQYAGLRRLQLRKWTGKRHFDFHQFHERERVREMGDGWMDGLCLVRFGDSCELSWADKQVVDTLLPPE